MNSIETKIQEDETLARQRAAMLFISYTRYIQFGIDAIAFLKEMFNVREKDDGDCVEIQLSSEQQTGLYELLKDESLEILSGCSAVIHRQFKYVPGHIRGELVAAVDLIDDAIGKLSFIQMLAEIPPARTEIVLSCRAVRGLVGILKNIEFDLVRIQKGLQSAGDSMVVDLESDTGSKSN